MKEKLITSAYPRSGSTYLNQALNLLYYPKQKANLNKHSVIAIENSYNILVAFRNPLDSIASWHRYPSNGELEADVKFYIRFYSAVLNKLDKIVLMEFDSFVKDINYIRDKVFKSFGIETNRYVTDTQIKEAMLTEGKMINLPRDNKEELTLVKNQLQNTTGFDKCLELYDQLKAQSL